jgi:hypothetical protein
VATHVEAWVCALRVGDKVRMEANMRPTRIGVVFDITPARVTVKDGNSLVVFTKNGREYGGGPNYKKRLVQATQEEIALFEARTDTINRLVRLGRALERGWSWRLPEWAAKINTIDQCNELMAAADVLSTLLGFDDGK